MSIKYPPLVLLVAHEYSLFDSILTFTLYFVSTCTFWSTSYLKKGLLDIANANASTC